MLEIKLAMPLRSGEWAVSEGNEFKDVQGERSPSWRYRHLHIFRFCTSQHAQTAQGNLRVAYRSLTNTPQYVFLRRFLGNI